MCDPFLTKQLYVIHCVEIRIHHLSPITNLLQPIWVELLPGGRGLWKEDLLIRQVIHPAWMQHPVDLDTTTPLNQHVLRCPYAPLSHAGSAIGGNLLRLVEVHGVPPRYSRWLRSTPDG